MKIQNIKPKKFLKDPKSVNMSNISNFNEKNIDANINNLNNNKYLNYEYRRNNSIRSKYKKINLSSKNRYDKEKEKVNIIYHQEPELKIIKVTKNKELFNKKLNTENEINQKYLKYREIKNREKNNSSMNIEESTSTIKNSHSKFLYYKRLKSKVKEESKDKEEGSKVKTKENKTPEEKAQNTATNFYINHNNLKKIPRRNVGQYNGYNSMNNIKLLNNNKIIEKEKKEENIKKKEISPIKEKQNVIKINLKENYKKKLLQNFKLINSEKTKKHINNKSLFKKNFKYNFKYNKCISNNISEISNIDENTCNTVIEANKDNLESLKEKTEKRYDIVGKEIIKNTNLYNEIKQKLEKIISISNLPSFYIDDYEELKSIGEGTYGKIYEVFHKKTSIKYAIKKIVANSTEKLENFLKEFEISYSNPHKNILNIHGIYIKCLDNKFVLYILMDLAISDWDTAIKERAKSKNYYTEKELIIILKQITSALVYLQKNRDIAHRDIKPENILIFENNIYKLSDFGEAKVSPNLKRENSLRGTEIYMSPLLYNGLKNKIKKIHHNIYKSDVFSFGYCFLFAASLNYNIIYSIRDLKFQGLVDKMLFKFMKSRFSKDFIEIISKMININENERLDFIGLEKILNEKYNNIII